MSTVSEEPSAVALSLGIGLYLAVAGDRKVQGWAAEIASSCVDGNTGAGMGTIFSLRPHSQLGK